MRSFPLKVVGLSVGWLAGWRAGCLAGLERVDRELFDRNQTFFFGTFAAGFKQLHD